MSIFEQKIIDTHHHLWDPTTEKYDWLTAEGHEVFNHIYLMDSLINDSGNLNLIKTVHVQAEINTDEITYETEWLQNISQNNKLGFPNAIVGFVDFMDPNFQQKLEEHQNYSNFRGIRQILNFDKNNPEISHAKLNYLKEDEWSKNFSFMEKFNLSFDLSILWSQAVDALKIIKKYNNVLFIINHTLSPININQSTINDWLKSIKLLSECDNVVIKLSGFGEFNSFWSQESIQPLILNCIESFGVNRCMFGSNFPVDKFLSTTKYIDYWCAYYNIVSNFSDDEKNKLFYINAEEYYKI